MGESWYERFRRKNEAEQTEEAWEACAIALPPGAVIIGTVAAREPFGLFLDTGSPFPALLDLASFPPEFNERRGGRIPDVGGTVRVVVIGHVGKEVRVSAKPEHLADPGRFKGHQFVLVRAIDNQRFIWLPVLPKREWSPGDVLPLGISTNWRVVRMIDPERSDRLPVLVVE